MGFDWSHRPAHFYRALVESPAYALSTAMYQIEKVYPEYPAQTLYAIGGGARAVERLQLFADVCGKTIKTADREDAALLGASLLAEKGTGMIEDLSETSQKNIHTDMVIEPDMEKNEKYQKYKVQYNQYCKEMTHLCKGLIR